MKRKYLNDAIIGNRKMIASLSEKGELLRLSYPTADYRQFIDYYETGVKINDSALIRLHNDINNVYNQYYSTDTNVLNTEIENTYFKLNMKQEDFIPMKKDVLIRRYTFTNYNKIDLDVKFLIESKLFSNLNNMVGTRICDNAMIQYSHDFAMTTFSNMPIYSYQLNNVDETISSGVIKDKDYIAMSNHSAIAYDVGVLRPGESKEFNVYIYINKNYKVDVLDDLIKEYNLYDYDKLTEEFPQLNELVQTVDTEPGDTLKDKIYKNFYYSGMNVDGLSDIVKIIITLTGLFGQAFELKTISLVLNVPLYINRGNVLMYLNFINQINEEDKNNIFETNILFALFIFFRDYEFIDDYKRIEEYTKTNNIYKRVLGKCNKEKLSIESYLKEIEKIIDDDKVTNKPFNIRKQND